MTQNRSQNSRQVLGANVYNRLKRLYVAATATPERLSFCYSIMLHVVFVIGLVILASVLQGKKNTLNLAGQRTIKTVATTEIVQATAISTQHLEEEVNAYQLAQKQVYEQKLAQDQQHQAKMKEIEEKTARAHEAELQRQAALKQAEEAKVAMLAEEKRKAEQEVKKAQEEKQNALAKKQEMQRQEQAEKLRKEQQELAKQKALAGEKKNKEAQLAAEKLAQQKAQEAAVKAAREAALNALRQSALSDLNAQSARASAQSATDQALQAYASAYKARIEAVWIMDDCRKISAQKLPTVMVMAGHAPRISVSSGSAQCDRALLLAFKNVQAPLLPADEGARKLIAEGIDFRFGQEG
ncbi:cell envelope integrity protein TolA [Caedibacter taeniospiralis]|jgi:TolA protein|uniref:cell envelope integrity protein TolA n=1 Tax=Caedibacter taeniospiralis TaxID=28907 RepID=UPI0037C14C67